MLRFPSPTCRYPGVYKGGMSITRSLSIIQMPLSSCNTTLEDDPPDEMIRVCGDSCEVVEGWPGERRVAERFGLISARNFRVTGCREGIILSRLEPEPLSNSAVCQFPPLRFHLLNTTLIGTSLNSERNLLADYYDIFH